MANLSKLTILFCTEMFQLGVPTKIILREVCQIILFLSQWDKNIHHSINFPKYVDESQTW